MRKSEELGVNMLQSVPSPTHLSHTTLSRIKRERYIFLKNCVRSFVRSFIIVDYVSACICIRIVVSQLYNNINT